MALYIQHGHGKADKIRTAIEGDMASGVILAARNETLSNLDTCIAELNDYECDVLFDPQFYVCTLNPPNDRYLPEDYSAYYTARRAADAFIGAKKISGYAKATLDFQAQRNLSKLIAPSVMFDSFNDRWCQVALTLADASIDYHSGLGAKTPPLLVTFVLNESALASKDDLDAFLNTITKWDVGGFYLIVERTDSSYSARFDDTRLANLMYLVHVLAHVNGYDVVCGYSDFVGGLLRAAGATAFATGWSQSQRQFHKGTFLRRRPGGRTPRLRYSSSPLMNSVFLSELQSIYDVGKLDSVLSGVPLDKIIQGAASPEGSAWNAPTSQLHHWQVLTSLDETLTGKPGVDIPAVHRSFSDAVGLYKELESEGVPFDRATDGNHLSGWLQAIHQFRLQVRI